MADETWAIIEITLGPMPPGTTWQGAALEAFSTQITEAVFAAEAEFEAGVSGMIRTIHRADDIGLGDTHPSVEEILTHIGHYTSTYCVHGLHGQCRSTCKHCDEPCKCHCHGAETGAGSVGLQPATP